MINILSYPIFKNNLNYCIKTMDIFKIDNWCMTNSLPYIITSIIELIENHGIIDSNNRISRISMNLLELSILSKMTINLEYSKLIQIKKTNKKELVKAQMTEKDQTIWKSGTGYGTNESSSWNIKNYIESNKYKINKYAAIILDILELININLEENIEEIINSCLIEFLLVSLYQNIDLELMEEYHYYYSSMTEVLIKLIDYDKKLLKNYINILDLSYENFKLSLNLYKSETMNKLNDILDLFIDNKKNVLLEDDYINKLQPHLFSMDSSFEVSNGSSDKLIAPKSNIKLLKEINILQKSLPLTVDSSIFVKVSDDNMQMIKALIIPSCDTPYANGCFIFDIFIPPTYPSSPPLFKLLTTANKTVRFNPNLYACGKVCLSLLGTWSGNQSEKWNETSTLLQVLISIQSLIFVEEPFYNEPGYETQYNSSEGNLISNEENIKYRYYTFRWAILENLKNPPKEFEEIIKIHYYYKKDIILEQIDKWSSLSNDKYIYKNEDIEELKMLLSNITLQAN